MLFSCAMLGIMIGAQIAVNLDQTIQTVSDVSFVTVHVAYAITNETQIV